MYGACEKGIMILLDVCILRLDGISLPHPTKTLFYYTIEMKLYGLYAVFIYGGNNTTC